MFEANYLTGIFKDESKENEDKRVAFRNVNMLNNLDGYLKKNPDANLLCAFGDGHLIGNTGFLRHSFKEGWSIKKANGYGVFVDFILPEPALLQESSLQDVENTVKKLKVKT